MHSPEGAFFSLASARVSLRKTSHRSSQRQLRCLPRATLTILLHRSQLVAMYIMHDIACIDANFISLTFLFLLFIAFFPVTCSIIRESDFPLAIVIYVLGFAACGFSLWFLWLYASWHHSLIDPEKPQLEIVARSVHLMLAPTYFSLSLLLLFVLPADHGSDLFWSWLLLPLAMRVIRWVLNYIPWFKRQQEAMQAHLPAKNEQVRPTR